MEKHATPPFSVTVTLTSAHIKEAVQAYLQSQGFDASMGLLNINRHSGDRPGESETYSITVSGVRPVR